MTITHASAETLTNLINPPGVDFDVRDEGSIYLFRPISDAAIDWAEQSLGDSVQWFHDSFVVEHRYVGDLIAQLSGEGFNVQC